MWSVFFVFLSYLDGEFVKADFLSSALDAEKESKEFFYLLNNTLCAKRSNVGEYHLLQVSDGIEEVRSVHDATGKLVDCALSTDHMQVKSFMYLCNLGLRGQVTVPVALNPSFKNINDVKFKCLQLKAKRASADTSDLPESEARESRRKVDASVLRRSKRGFTYPGTLWCGAGNNADHYDQLGEFADTDKCCREHDHCPHVIHAFSSNYGYTNFKWHSISHCDCDNAMKACLRNVNDSSSRIVGQAFFNVIEVPCFELAYQEQCIDRHWYGVCKQYGQVPVAVIKETTPYDFGGIDVIDELPLPPLDKTASSQQPASAQPGETGSQGAGGSTTQSTASSSSSSASTSGSQTTSTAMPEAPSLTNVVTAAEDFIKVLATVSSSQSSSPDAAKEEAQGAEKKRKKNAGGKKRKSKKRRGKGRKRKLNAEMVVVRTNEGGVGAASCHVVMDDSVSSSSSSRSSSTTNIIDDPARGRQSEANADNFMRSEMSREAREELTNAMMRDDPQRSHSVTPSSAPEESKEQEVMEKHKKESKVTTATTSTRPLTSTPSVTLSIVKTQHSEMSTLPQSTTASTSTTPSPPSVTVSILRAKNHRDRLRQGHVRRHRIGLRTHSSLHTPQPREKEAEEEQSITVSVRGGGDETTFAESEVEAAGRLSSSALGNANEKGPLRLATAMATTAGAPTVITVTVPLRQAKDRRGSKERGGRKRAGKVKPPPSLPPSEAEPVELPNHQTPPPADSREEPASMSPPVSATEASSTAPPGMGYHVVPTPLDYLSVARPVRPTTARSRGADTLRKGKGRWQRLKDSFRERQRKSHIFGIRLTQTPASALPFVQSTETVADKADYGLTTSPTTVGLPATIATGTSMPATTNTATLPPLPQPGTSTPVQPELPIKDTHSQDAPLMLLAGHPPSRAQKPKRKRHERLEGKKRKKAPLAA